MAWVHLHAVGCRSVQLTAVQGTLLLPTCSPDPGFVTGPLPAAEMTVPQVVRQRIVARQSASAPGQRPLALGAPDLLPLPDPSPTALTVTAPYQRQMSASELILRQRFVVL